MKSSIKHFYKIILFYFYKSMPIMYLYKSKSKNKKYTIVMEDDKQSGLDKSSKGKSMKHRFGAKGYRDYTLINNKNSKYYLPNKEDREKVKRYLNLYLGVV